MHKILRPAIGVGAAALLAAGGAFLGVQGAHEAATTSEDSVVLAPVAINGVPVSTATGPGDEVVSGGTGVARIVAAGTADPSELPADAAAAAAALDASGGTDGGTTYTIVGGGGSGGATGTDDPCAASDPPADCPSGLRSAIFADTAPPELEVFPVADVATSPVGTSIYCPDVAPGAGDLGLGVGTTVPAAVTVRYWPVSDPSHVKTVTPDGVQSQVDDWNARFAATGSYPVHEFVFQHCGLLTELTPHTDYVLSAVAVDDFGRVSDPVERTFSSDGQPTIPQMQVIPLTNNVLYVSVPYYPGNTPLVQAWTIADGAPADCSTSAIPPSALQTIRPESDVTLSEDYLHANNYVDGYNHAVVDLYDVPEGSTVVVCARTYPHSGPSWVTGHPISQQFVIAQSPDQVVPIVTLTGLNVTHDVDAYAITVEANTQTGLNCGGAQVPTDPLAGGSSASPNATLCDPTTAARSWIAPPGAGGNLVLATSVRWGSGVVHSTFTLPLSRYACVGTCALPATLDYSIPLPIVTVGTGMCGSGFGGDCTPPTADTSLGTASIHVEWSQGNVNGRTSWSVGTPDPRPLDPPPPPPAPQFDISIYPAVTLSADGWTGTAALSFVTDRHATYTVSISGDCFIGDPPAPVTGETTGGAPAGTPDVYGGSATFSDLCPGGTYIMRVELVDDTGARTVASNGRDPGETWWPGSIVSVPVRQYAITGTLTVTTDRTAGFYRAWKLGGGAIDFFQNTLLSGGYHATFPANTCFAAEDRNTVVPGAITATTPQGRTVPVYVYARALMEGLYFGVNHDADCSWPGPITFLADDEHDVSWADLQRGVTITGDFHQADITPIPGYDTPQMHYTLHLLLGHSASTF